VSRRTLIAMACLAAVAANAIAAEGDLPPDAAKAVGAGIAYLVRTQNPDGSWLSDGATGLYPTAMTSLAGLALLAEGNTCYSGPHAPNVRRAVEYLLQQADPATGLIGGYEGGRPMFGHGFAMLFLAQVYGTEGQEDLRRRIRAVLTKAIALTVSSQSKLGGWYYTPGSPEDEGAVTVTQMQGLRACADAGLPVPAATVEAAMAYIRRAANPDGGIAYRAGIPGESRPGITCAALAVMYAAGIYKSDLVTNALAYVQKNVATRAPSSAGGGHFFYEHLYLAQVMYFRGGDAWRDYSASLNAWLAEAQRPDGSWSGDFIGAAYGTSVALIILQLPLGNVPAFQR
jgi:squalene cyclase